MCAATCTSVYNVCKVSGRLQDLHLRRTLGTRPVRAAGWQGGRQDGLVVFNCLLVTGWNFPPTFPRVCRGAEFFCGFLFVVLFFFWGGGGVIFLLRVGSTVICLDGGSRGGSDMSREGHGRL